MASFSGLTRLAAKFSRLSVVQAAPTCVQLCQRCIHTQPSPLLFQATTQLWAAPMKKKKKVDQGVLLARENKRKRKIEKQMRRLEKFGRRFKPIDEIDGDPKLRSEFELRRREPAVLTFDESEHRALLHKDWSRSKLKEFKKEATALTSLLQAQERALEELKFESEELYNMAIQLDETLLPLEIKGPTATPPIKGYVAPDGEYIDTTKTFD